MEGGGEGVQSLPPCSLPCPVHLWPLGFTFSGSLQAPDRQRCSETQQSCFPISPCNLLTLGKITSLLWVTANTPTLQFTTQMKHLRQSWHSTNVSLHSLSLPHHFRLWGSPGVLQRQAAQNLSPFLEAGPREWGSADPPLTSMGWQGTHFGN